MPVPGHWRQRLRPLWPDIAWAAFVGLNLAAMRLLPAWQTVAADSLVLDALERWGHVPRRWRLGEVAVVIPAVPGAKPGECA